MSSSEGKEAVRLALVQWVMKGTPSLEGFFQQLEGYLEDASASKSDFVVFPELFTAPLISQFSDLPEMTAIRKLAGYTAEIAERGAEYARRFQINIILGSMPYIDEDRLLNVGYLCRRDGSTERYGKVHITPAEREGWGMVGADSLRLFDTDCGKIGVLVCYDVEFPELGRILAEQGMEILFVPFQTDTENGYYRVRCCGRARAIENECYVVMAGSIGELPEARNMNLHFAQSAVFSPSESAFLPKGVHAEAELNAEALLVTDVDLSLLPPLHERGAVQNLRDRRFDMYQVRYTGKPLI